MSVLPDHEIASRNLITPFDRAQLQPASYDLTLGPELLIPQTDEFHGTWTVDLVNKKCFLGLEQRGRRALLKDLFKTASSEGYLLAPGTCALASTAETLHLSADLASRVEGKSSLGRVFLAVHVTAGFADPGFEGQVTLELVNHGPFTLVLHAGMSIAQVNFTQLTSRCERPYGSPGLKSHYQGQQGPTAAKS